MGGPSQSDTGSRETSQRELQKERIWTWMGPSAQKEAGKEGYVPGRTMNQSPRCAQGNIRDHTRNGRSGSSQAMAFIHLDHVRQIFTAVNYSRH